jgi:hypothetical protein
MWRRPIAAATAAATIIAMGTVPPAAAWAAGPGELVYGYLDGDRLIDRARLGATARSCAVLVELGRPEGVYLPPRWYPYQVPGNGSSLVCPNLGVAVDLDEHPPQRPGPAELVVGWYGGDPGRSGNDLLVLRNFTVSMALPALDKPNYIGLADFDGDRRLDVYTWTDQGEGFATYLNTGGGILVPGPVRYCADQREYRLADFNRNGATDLVIAYDDRCADGWYGVTVVLDDGTVFELQNADDGRPSWMITVLYADRNDVPDILVYQPSGELWTFLGVGNGTFVRSPLAIRDTATVAVTETVRIMVLANDWASRRARVSIVVPPRYGTVDLAGGRSILYRPGPVSELTDQFVYRVTQDGHTSDAPVLVKVLP